MRFPIYHVAAFTDRTFRGNPAAVCILDEWLPDSTLQAIAAEHHLPATAFLVPKDKRFAIRWFAPEYEIDLCGHGTLASAYVILTILEPSWQELEFIHPRAGLLKIKRTEDAITLNFPAKNVEPLVLPESLVQGLGIKPKAAYQYKTERCLAVLKTEEEIKQLKPNMQLLKELPYRGFIVTARSNTVDFVSRVFYPQKAIYEDAMTGSSYCLLVPYWAAQLKQEKFYARQLSSRGGEVFCELNGENVLLTGKAMLYMQGTIYL